jgi:hypothetical protein
MEFALLKLSLQRKVRPDWGGGCEAVTATGGCSRPEAVLVLDGVQIHM